MWLSTSSCCFGQIFELGGPIDAGGRSAWWTNSTPIPRFASLCIHFCSVPRFMLPGGGRGGVEAARRSCAQNRPFVSCLASYIAPIVRTRGIAAAARQQPRFNSLFPSRWSSTSSEFWNMHCTDPLLVAVDRRSRRVCLHQSSFFCSVKAHKLANACSVNMGIS